MRGITLRGDWEHATIRRGETLQDALSGPQSPDRPRVPGSRERSPRARFDRSNGILWARRAWRYIHHHGVPPIAWLTTGLWLIVTALPRWFTDTKGRARAEAISDPMQHVAAMKAHNDTVTRHRGYFTAWGVGWFALGAAALAAAWAWQHVPPGLVPHLPRIAAATLIVAALIVGYTKPEPMPQGEGGPTPVDPAHVTAALAAALPKVASAVKADPAAVTYRGRGAYPTPAGWRIEANLPLGATTTDARKATDRLAGALGRRSEVVLVTTGDSEAHLILDVLNEPLRSMPQPPLDLAGTVDVWQPRPVGYDAMGRAVTVPWAGFHRIVGGTVGSGKSTTVCGWLADAARDPLVTLNIADIGGARDFAELEPRCDYYRVGDDDDDMDALVALIGSLEREVRRRRTIVRDNPDDFPTGSVDRAGAIKHGLTDVITFIDESHLAMDRIGDRIETLARICRKFAMQFVFADQDPTARTMPPGLSRVIAVRLALAVESSTAGKVILGDGLVSAGYNPATLTPGEDVGVGWFKAAGKPTLIRSWHVSRADVARVVSDADCPPPMGERVRDDDGPGGLRGAFLAGWPTNADGSPVAGVHLDEAADLLGWATDTLRERMAEEGIPVNSDVRRKRGERWRTRQGVKLSDLTTASDGMSDGLSAGVA